MSRVFVFQVIVLLLNPSIAAAQTADDQSISNQRRISHVHPNEPTGYSLISDRPFETRTDDRWKARQDSRFRIASDPSAPISPPSVGEAFYPAGFKGGGGPIDTYVEFGERSYRSIYISAWIKPSDNFRGAPSNGINKIFHVWIGGGSVVVVSMQGKNRGPLVPQIRLQGIQADGRGVSFNLSKHISRASAPGFRIERGSWSHLEVLLRVNTPGQSNGEAHLWINGQKAGEDTHVGFRRFGRDASWERVSWNPTWGSPRDVVTQPMALYMDQVYVSGVK